MEDQPPRHRVVVSGQASDWDALYEFYAHNEPTWSADTLEQMTTRQLALYTGRRAELSRQLEVRYGSAPQLTADTNGGSRFGSAHERSAVHSAQGDVRDTSSRFYGEERHTGHTGGQ